MSLRVIHTGERTPEFNWTAKHMRQFAVLMRSHLVRRTFDLGIGMDGQPLAKYSTRPITVSFESDLARRLKPKGGLPAYGRGRARSRLDAQGRHTERRDAVRQARRLGAKSVNVAQRAADSAQVEVKRAEAALHRSNTAESRAAYRAAVRNAKDASRRAEAASRLADRSLNAAKGTAQWTVTGRFYVNGYSEYKLSSRRGTTNAAGQRGSEVDLILSGQMSRSIRVISSTRTEAVIGMTGDARNYGAYVDESRPFMGFSDKDHEEGQVIMMELATVQVRKPGGSRGSL